MAKESIAIYLGIILCSMVCLICLMCIVAFVGFGLSITTIVLFAGAGDGCPEYDTFNWIVFYSLIGFYVYGCCAGCAKVILISVFAPKKMTRCLWKDLLTHLSFYQQVTMGFF